MKPLEGIRIIDFTRLLPGPLGCRFLAEMGAEVIKVEEKHNPDPTRQYPPFREEISWLFMALNAGKQHVEYDGENPEHRAALDALLASADVLVEQYKPGTLEKMGYGFERLSALNPRLVYISLSGYPEGSSAFFHAGHDINYMAESGVLAYNKGATGQPVVPAFQTADIAGGSFGLVMAVLAGLLERQRTGKGLHQRVAMTSFTRHLAFLPALWEQLHGGLQGYLLAGNMPNYGIYATQDGWVALGALEPKFWTAFCDAVGHPEWAMRLFTDTDGGQSLREEVAVFMCEHTTRHILNLCSGQACCISQVQDGDSWMKSPSVGPKEFFVWPDGPKGAVQLPAFPLGNWSSPPERSCQPGAQNVMYGFHS
ncbi:MAG: CoA transferase [Flavobacteriales bacterium]|nr:CoA transferase [Flavobacteriales bacterium]MDW8431638.1 CoA transferase [Flavobacteriales bacterium]